MRRGSGMAWGWGAVLLLAASAVAPAAPGVVAPPAAPGVVAPEVAEKEYDLAEVVRMASADHPQVAAAQASVARGLAGVREARAAAQPRVGVTLGYTQLQDAPHFSVSPFGTLTFGDRENLTAGVGVQYPLATGGRLAAMRRQAEAGVDALQAREQRVSQQAGLRASERYFDVLRAEQMIGVMEEQVKALEAQRSAVEKMRAAGLVSKIDLLRTDVALSGAREALVKARSNRAVAAAALAEAMGLPAETPLRLSGKYDETQLPAGLPGAIAEALSGRAELREVQAGAAAARSGVAVARSGRKPQVAAFAQADAVRPTYMPRTGALSAGVLLTFALSDGNATAAQVAAAQAEQARVVAEQRELENGIRLEVTQRFLEVQSARERIATTQVAVSAAEESQRLATVGYQSGVTPLTDVLQSQADLTRARSDLLMAQFDLRIAQSRLADAIGR